MNRYSLSLLLSLLLIPPSTLYLGGCVPKSPASQTQTILSAQDVEKVAQRITVRVIVGDNKGSGTLIQHEDGLYTVLTNRHVIELGDSYTIQTPDGKTHSAQLRSANTGYDLALLQFTSDDFHAYSVAIIGNPLQLEAGEEVYAAGFPYDENGLQVSRGNFSMYPDLTLKDGYAIGYSNEILQGMSGGAILNREGKLIGINGRSAFPIEPDFEFEDGTKPSQELVEKMIPLSWGVPISTVGKIAPNLIPTPIPKLTGIAAKVNDIAEKITVRIDYSHNASGVIVAKDSKTYYVLTNDHVMDEEDDYEIVTPDGKRHAVDYEQVTRFEGVDLAVVPFRSRESYTVAQLANYRLGLDERALVFSSGWAKGNPYRRFTAGFMFSEEKGAVNLNDSSTLSQTRGYELVYSNPSQPGMSGGAILDVEGRVVGINAGADGEWEYLDEIQLGYSYGVPIRTFLRLANQAQINPEFLKVKTSVARGLTLEDLNVIFSTLLYSISPQNGSATDWLNYGNSLWRTWHYDEAVNAFNEAIRQKSDFYQAYYARGLALKDSEKYLEALDSFSQATRYNTQFYPAWREQGVIFHEILGQYSTALAAFDKAIKINPNDAVLHLMRGNVLLQSKRYTEAIEVYNQAVNLNPQLYAAYNNRGNAYNRLGENSKAIEDFNHAITLDPQLYAAYNNRGNAYNRLGEGSKAIENFNHAITLNPEYASAYNNRGSTYHELGESSRAIEDYNRAITLNPEYASAYYNRGVIYTKLEEDMKAIEDYSNAITLNPEYASAYNNRGIIYSELGESSKAIEDFNRAITIYNSRGVSYTISIENSKKPEDRSRTISINPQLASVYYLRGQTYFQLKEYDKAIEDYNRAIANNPQDGQFYFRRGLTYFITITSTNVSENQQKAIEDLEKAASLFRQQGDTESYESAQTLLKGLSQ